MSASLRLGILRLSDSAPALVAEARGLFLAGGLDVRIMIEPSWANILDKLTWGLMDAAIVMPPLAIAAVLGLRGAPARLVVPMGLSSGGNSVVVGQGAWTAAHGAGTPAEAARALLGWMRTQPAPPRFGVVHRYSTHNLLLRHWLGAEGGVAERDWQTVVVPPQETAAALAQGAIAGFCAGAPWGDEAVAAGAGRVLLGSSALWPDHPEKCLAVSADWAESRPSALGALLRAMLAASAVCADAGQGGEVAALLAGAGLPYPSCREALPGGGGREIIRFAQQETQNEPGVIALPNPGQLAWFLARMGEHGWVNAGKSSPLDGLYRPDLLEAALRTGSDQVLTVLAQK